MNKKGIIKYFWFLSAFLIVILAGTWAFQISKLASLSRGVAFAQTEVAEITAENTSFASGNGLREIPALEKVAQALNFQKIEQVSYIRASEPTVLAR
jgi:hypothetical protein